MHGNAAHTYVHILDTYGETAAASGEKQELGQRLRDFAHEIVSYGSFTCVWEYADPPLWQLVREKGGGKRERVGRPKAR